TARHRVHTSSLLRTSRTASRPAIRHFRPRGRQRFVTTCDPALPLESLGWDAGWSDTLTAQRERVGDDVGAARVTRVDRGSCTVLAADGVMRVTLGGQVLQRMAADATQAPCTGDWCAVRSWPDGPVTIEAVLPRRSSVVRADTGGSSRGQVLVANV